MSDTPAPSLSPAPSPAPSPAVSPAASPEPLRPGQVVATWRTALVVGWAAISVALMVTAGAAEVLHRSVWWIGDRSDPAPVLVALVPFALPIAVIVMALLNKRWVCEVSALAALGMFVVAHFDRTESPSAAVVTAALGVSGVLLTIASFAGRVRAA